MVRHQLPLPGPGARPRHRVPPRSGQARSPSSTRPRALGITPRPVMVGPVTFLLLAKAAAGTGAPIERLDAAGTGSTPNCWSCARSSRRRLGAARRTRAGPTDHRRALTAARRRATRRLGALDDAPEAAASPPTSVELGRRAPVLAADAGRGLAHRPRRTRAASPPWLAALRWLPGQAAGGRCRRRPQRLAHRSRATRLGTLGDAARARPMRVDVCHVVLAAARAVLDVEAETRPRSAARAAGSRSRGRSWTRSSPWPAA